MLILGYDSQSSLRHVHCPSCGYWNRVSVNKIFIEQPSQEPKVKVMIPMYQPSEVSKCKKCGKIIAEPKELTEFWKKHQS